MSKKGNRGRRRRGRLAAAVLATVLMLPPALAALLVFGVRLGVSDTQKAAWAMQAVATAIPGRISVGSLHWELPAVLTLHDVGIYESTDPPGGGRSKSAEGEPLVSAKTVAATLDLAQLLRHRVALSDVHIEDGRVAMTREDPDGTFDLAEAFVTPTPDDAVPEPKSAAPWMVSLDAITLERVDFTLSSPGLRIAVRDASAEEGAYWIRGDTMGVSARLTAHVAIDAGDTRLRVQNANVLVEQGVWNVVGDDNVDIGIKRLRVEAQDNRVDAGGHFQLEAMALHHVDARADLQLDTSSALLRERLPSAVTKHLRGKLAIAMSAKGDAAALDFDVQAGPLPDTPTPLFGHLVLDGLHVGGTYAAPTLHIKTFDLRSAQARLQAEGRVAIHPDKAVHLGAHKLQIKGHTLPLARALEPFVSGATLLPGHVDVQLDCEGAALWPPRSTADLLMSVREVPKKLIGVPDPFDIDARLIGMGDKIRIQHFKLRGEDTDFALEGDIPVRPDGVVDVLSELKQVKAGKSLKRLKVPLGMRELRLRTRLTGTFADPHAEGTLEGDDITAREHVMQLRAPFVFAGRTLRLNRAGLQLEDGRAEVSGALTFDAAPTMDLCAAFKNVAAAATGLPLTGDIDGTVTARGPLATPVAKGRLSWHDAGWDGGHAKGEVVLEAQSDTRGMHLQKLELAPDGGGALTFAGDVRWDTRQLDVTLEAREIGADWLARMGGAELEGARGVLRARGRVRGPWEEARGDAAFVLEKAGMAGFDIGDVNVTVQGDASRITGTVALAQGRSRVTLTSNFFPPTREHPGRAAGTAELNPVWLGDFLPDLAARSTDLTLKTHGRWSWNPHAGLHASAELEELVAHIADKTMALENPAHVRWSRGEASVDDMHLRGELASLWVRGHWGNTVDAQADGHLDLRVLSDFVPTIGSADGAMEVALRVEGHRAHPSAHGRLHITSPVVLRLRQVPGEIYVDRGVVTLTPRGVGISDWRGRYGFGALELDGHVALTDLKPSSYDVQLRASDIPCRTPELLLELNADMRVTGRGNAPLVKGKIDITRGRYIKRFDLHDFYVQAKPGAASVALKDKAPGLQSVGLDVHVGTSNELVVNVDAGIFAVKTDLQADLHVTGNPVYPKINGNLRAEGGTLKFPEASLALTEATLDFTPSAGHAIDAKVHMLGEGTVTSSGANSQTYAVTLQLDGDLDKMLLDLRATPDRTKLEVLSLLTTGHADLSELVQQSPGDSDSKLNAALVFAGSQVSEPVTRYAAAQIERYAKLKVDLAAQVTQDTVTLTASKQVMSRLRLQGAYQHGIGTDTAAVVAGAQVALTDQLFFEGTQTLPTASSNTVDNYAQGSLQLKWRLLGH